MDCNEGTCRTLIWYQVIQSMISSSLDMIDFVGTYIPILEKTVMGCHGNHALSHSPNQFIYGGPREQFAPIQKCPWGAR